MSGSPQAAASAAAVLSRPRVLVVMRGCSGSGKSTFAKRLIADRIVHMPASIPALFSTDDFWLVPASDGSDTSGYVHDAMRLSEAHAWNQARAIAAMESRSSDFVVIDNTNLCLWEARPYVEAAVRCDYTVCAQEPDTPWWQARDAEQLFSRGTHGVPLEAIVRMLERFEEPFSVEAVLNAVPPQRRAKQRGRNNNMRNGNGSNNKF